MGNKMLSECHNGNVEEKKDFENIERYDEGRLLGFKQENSHIFERQETQRYNPRRSNKIDEIYKRMIIQKGIISSIQGLIQNEQREKSQKSQKCDLKCDLKQERKIKKIIFTLRMQQLKDSSILTNNQKHSYRARSYSKSIKLQNNQDNIQEQTDSPSPFQILNIFNKTYIYIGHLNEIGIPHGPGQLYNCDFENLISKQQNQQKNYYSQLFIQGLFIDGCLNCQDCIIITQQGNFYRGAFHQNTFNGKGHLKINHLFQLNGLFLQGSLQGKGKILYQDGGCYEGNLKKGLRYGKGKMVWKSLKKVKAQQCDLEIRYQGYFQGDKMNGLGYLRTPNYEYWGPFNNNMKQGKGTIKFKDDRKFQGWFQKDEINGYGQLHYPDGKVQKGIFPLNKEG